MMESPFSGRRAYIQRPSAAEVIHLCHHLSNREDLKYINNAKQSISNNIPPMYGAKDQNFLRAPVK
jgi:hypothetical protein